MVIVVVVGGGCCGRSGGGGGRAMVMGMPYQHPSEHPLPIFVQTHPSNAGGNDVRARDGGDRDGGEDGDDDDDGAYGDRNAMRGQLLGQPGGQPGRRGEDQRRRRGQAWHRLSQAGQQRPTPRPR